MRKSRHYMMIWITLKLGEVINLREATIGTAAPENKQMFSNCYIFITLWEILKIIMYFCRGN